MSNRIEQVGVTMHDDGSDEDSEEDMEYELRQVKPQISGSSSLRRKKRNCCTKEYLFEWLSIFLAVAIFYIFNGLFTWAMIEAMLSNTYNTLVTFGCVWIVFVIVYFTLILVISNRKRNELLEQAQRLRDAELKRREDIRATLEREKNNS